MSVSQLQKQGLTTVRITLSESLVNMIRIAVFHAGYLATTVVACSTLPFWIALFVVCLLALIHQREISEWIHEGSHFNIVPNRIMNDRVTNLFCGSLHGISVQSYRYTHLQHHRVTRFFCESDPETSALPLTTKGEFWKAVVRDISGVSALSRFFSVLGRNSSLPESPALKQPKWFLPYVLGLQITLISLFTLTGFLMVYIGYYFTLLVVYPLFLLRFRVFGQHLEYRADGCAYASNSSTSRSIEGGAIDRIFIASDIMAFHHEHHQFPQLPYRELKKLCQRSKDPNRYGKSRWQLLKDFYRGLK